MKDEDSIEKLGLTDRTMLAVRKLGVRTVGELAAYSEFELLGIKGFGVYTVSNIVKRMEANGRKLRRV